MYSQQGLFHHSEHQQLYESIGRYSSVLCTRLYGKGTECDNSRGRRIGYSTSIVKLILIQLIWFIVRSAHFMLVRKLNAKMSIVIKWLKKMWNNFATYVILENIPQTVELLLKMWNLSINTFTMVLESFLFQGIR